MNKEKIKTAAWIIVVLAILLIGWSGIESDVTHMVYIALFVALGQKITLHLRKDARIVDEYESKINSLQKSLKDAKDEIEDLEEELEGRKKED